MSKYPPKIPIPESVIQQRNSRIKEMVSAGKKGVSIRIAIIAAEISGYVFFTSSALLLDALSSLLDVATSLFLIFCIKQAGKPPDRNHPFGHGRFEPIAGLQLGLLLVVVGGGMLFQQASTVFKGSEFHVISPYAWIIPFMAVILLEISYRVLIKTAAKQDSPALLADAWHYRIDSANSFVAMIALIVAAFYPDKSAFIDHMGAIAIAIFMMGIGAFAARKNFNQLVDRTPSKEYFEKVRTAAMRVDGVRATEKLRLQVYGPDAHVSIDIELDPYLSVDAAHTITQKVRTEIQKEWPSVRDVIVHVEPYFPGDHEPPAL